MPSNRATRGLLERGFAELSDESRRRRFLTPIDRLDNALLAYLMRIDHRHHEALGACGPRGEPVGVARYVRLVDDPQGADVAVAVVDAWQQRGVATELLTRLVARAQANGIRRFGAALLPDNLEAVELLSAASAAQGAESSSGLLEFEPFLSTSCATVMTAELLSPEGEIGVRHDVGYGAQRCR